MKNKVKWLYLFLLLPAYLLFLTFQQIMVYQGLSKTYNNGTSLIAEVEEFEIKHIASQTNGYVILEYTPPGEESPVSRKLSLPVQLASEIMDSKVIPIQYYKDSSQPVVMVATYDSHRNIVLTNMGITFLSFLICALIGWFIHRYIRRKLAASESSQTELIIERIDE